ncbi:hypothetical protein BT67DRAFT_291379 [Trichocladium antarcticum]|uniref:Uncharacterized protein n=1 Tax=Trichocladium antarcticum TaxID=1450529 RepID=A0AAN6ZEN3_9PEZI|nr:hypothetical protein BT67DRAFT_291379 [Trichocladium antarcticum]
MGAWLQRKARWQPLVLVAISPECKWRFCCRAFALYTCQNHWQTKHLTQVSGLPGFLVRPLRRASCLTQYLRLRCPACSAGVGWVCLRRGKWIDNDKDPIAGFIILNVVQILPIFPRYLRFKRNGYRGCKLQILLSASSAQLTLDLPRLYQYVWCSISYVRFGTAGAACAGACCKFPRTCYMHRSRPVTLCR